MKNPFLRGFLIIALLALPTFLIAQEIVLSVSDFSVESENPKYKFIGKGISTLVAGELRRTKAVKLLEREQMNKIIAEQKLTLTGMLDDSQQVEIGKLMAANYIVFGEIVDMADTLLVSVRMADVGTGELVWEDSLMEKLESYDYIGAFFAQSILNELNLTVQKETVAKVETKEVKQEAAVVALSVGIDAYDKGDEKTAKEELKAVQKLDPKNQAAAFYLSKLQAVSPKFRVETVEYATPYSPASLGFIDKLKIYEWMGFPLIPPGVEPGNSIQDVGDYTAGDTQNTWNIGISLPLGKRFGLGAGYLNCSQNLNSGTDTTSPNALSLYIVTADGESRTEMFSEQHYNGGFLSCGVRLFDWMSIGTSLIGWYAVAPEGGSNIGINGFALSVYPGLMFRIPDGNLTFDLHVAYTTQTMYYPDYVNHEVLLGNMPLVIDTSFTYGLLNQRLFLGLKGIADIYYDARGGHALQIIPMVEGWPLKFLSLRAGYVYSHLSQAGTLTVGHGFVGGLTVKVWKFDINANLTYRQKPVRLLPGYTIANMKLLLGIEFTPDWITR